MGSFKTPSRLTGNKEQQHEERNGTDPEEKEQTGKHIIMESDTAIIIITLFYLLQLGEVNIEFLEEITKEVLHFFRLPRTFSTSTSLELLMQEDF